MANKDTNPTELKKHADLLEDREQRIDDTTSITKSFGSVNIQSATATGLLELSVGDEVDIQVQNLDDATDITVVDANLTLHRISAFEP